MSEQPTKVVVVNLRSLVFWALAVYLVFRFIDAITVTLLVFGLAFFFAAILDPPMRWLARRGVPRGMAVGIIALGMLCTVGLAFYFAIPPLVEQAGELGRNVPRYARQLQERAEEFSARHPDIRTRIEQSNIAQDLAGFGKNIAPQIGRLSLTALGGLFSLFLVFILTLYIVADPKPLVRGVVFAMPKPHRKTTLRILVHSSRQLQNWVRATFWLMLSIGVSATVGLWLMGVKSPLLFGLIAGIGEAIPTIGPILTAIPPILVTLADDPQKALWVAVFFIVLQQVENNLLVPRIMASSLKLHTVSVTFFVITMGTLIGPVGILLSTPLCAIIKVVYQELHRRRNETP